MQVVDCSTRRDVVASGCLHAFVDHPQFLVVGRSMQLLCLFNKCHLLRSSCFDLHLLSRHVQSSAARLHTLSPARLHSPGTIKQKILRSEQHSTSNEHTNARCTRSLAERYSGLRLCSGRLLVNHVCILCKTSPDVSVHSSTVAGVYAVLFYDFEQENHCFQPVSLQGIM